MLFYWLKLFSDIVFGARLWSAIVGSLAVIFFFLFCRLIEKLENKDHSIFPYFSTLIFSLSNTSFYYSQEIRTYILLVCLSIISSGLYIKILYKNQRIFIPFYIILTIFMLYSSLFAILIFFVQVVFYIYLAILSKDKVIPKKPWIFTVLIIFLLYIPILVKSYNPLLAHAQGGVIGVPVPSFKSIFIFIVDILHSKYCIFDQIVRYLILALIIIYIVKMCFILAKRQQRINLLPEINIFVFLMLWIVIPILVMFIVSRLFISIFVRRYLITILIPLCILGGHGYAIIRKKIISILILIVLFAAYTFSYCHWFNFKHKDQYKNIFSYIEKTKCDIDKPLVFINPAWYGLPILCNLNIKEFRQRHDFSDVFRCLEKENIYPYRLLKEEELSSGEILDFFVLLGIGIESNEKIINDLDNNTYLCKSGQKFISPFTILHYLTINEKDRVIKLSLNDNIYKKINVQYNEDYKTVYPERYNEESQIIYKYSTDNLSGVKVFLCMQSYVIYLNNYIKVFAGNNCGNMELLYAYENKKDGQELLSAMVDMTKYVKNNSILYIKLEFLVNQKNSKTVWDSRLEKMSFLIKK